MNDLPGRHALPRRGNTVLRRFGRFALHLLGWDFRGSLPDSSRLVVIVAPHTSNWDFVIGILAVFALDIKAHWIGKHTLFKPPFRPVMQWLGGIPVDRSVPNDLVNRTRDKFRREEKFLVGIAPEGTRKRVAEWKKGFYRIAEGAGVPILCAGLDYRSQTIVIGPLIEPSGDYEADFAKIRTFFADITARHPGNFYLPSGRSAD